MLLPPMCCVCLSWAGMAGTWAGLGRTWGPYSPHPPDARSAPLPTTSACAAGLHRGLDDDEDEDDEDFDAAAGSEGSDSGSDEDEEDSEDAELIAEEGGWQDWMRAALASKGVVQLGRHGPGLVKVPGCGWETGACVLSACLARRVIVQGLGGSEPGWCLGHRYEGHGACEN